LNEWNCLLEQLYKSTQTEIMLGDGGGPKACSGWGGFRLGIPAHNAGTLISVSTPGSALVGGARG